MLSNMWDILPIESGVAHVVERHGHAAHGGFLSHVAIGTEGVGAPNRHPAPKHAPGRVYDSRAADPWPTVRFEGLAPGLIKPFLGNESAFTAPVRHSTGAPLLTTRPGARPRACHTLQAEARASPSSDQLAVGREIGGITTALRLFTPARSHHVAATRSQSTCCLCEASGVPTRLTGGIPEIRREAPVIKAKPC